MSYKAILVHVDKTDNVSARIKLAATVALNEHAHLIGIAVTGIASFLYQAGLVNNSDPALATHLQAEMDILREGAQEALDDFSRIVQKLQVRSVETLMVDDQGEEFMRLARCSDLIVVGQADPAQPTPAVTPDFPEQVVLHAGRPLVIVPYAGEVNRFGSKVMLAWDASLTATRAVAYALPILKRADLVEVVVFNAVDPQLGADVVHYLAHHGIKADLIRQEADIDVGNALLSMAADLHSDSIVMGAYGHARLREKLLGGVTRTVLGSMTVPVLMAN
jgi:nucleotide-binding universal stress UspA family protein